MAALPGVAPETAKPTAVLGRFYILRPASAGQDSGTDAAWAQLQVALAAKENLVVYRTGGTFPGAKDMTRGGAAIIIYRLFQKLW